MKKKTLNTKYGVVGKVRIYFQAYLMVNSVRNEKVSKPIYADKQFI